MGGAGGFYHLNRAPYEERSGNNERSGIVFFSMFYRVPSGLQVHVPLELRHSFTFLSRLRSARSRPRRGIGQDAHGQAPVTWSWNTRRDDVPFAP